MRLRTAEKSVIAGLQRLVGSAPTLPACPNISSWVFKLLNVAAQRITALQSGRKFFRHQGGIRHAAVERTARAAVDIDRAAVRAKSELIGPRRGAAGDDSVQDIQLCRIAVGLERVGDRDGVSGGAYEERDG